MEFKLESSMENAVKNTIRKYTLLNKKDKVLIACSGGKDSTAVLYLLKKFGYNVEAIIIDLLIGEWSKKNLKNLKKFCKEQSIKLHVVSIRKELGKSMCYIRSVIKSKEKLTNCMICGVLKKWILNKEARKLKADKIATGHNLDDEAQTILMNYLKGNPVLSANLGPKTGIIENKKFVTRIKPLYFIPEKLIEKYSKTKKFPVLYKKCPCAVDTYRVTIRKVLNELEKKHPKIKENILKSFLEFQPSMRKKASKEIRYCVSCGEPSKYEDCMACRLMKKLK